MIPETVLITLLKFILIGIGGTVIDFGITFLLKEKAKVDKYLANSSGYIVDATSNYIFNRIWAFDNNNPEILRQYLIFLTISLIGLAALNLFIWIFHEKLKTNFYVAKVIALFIVLIWTFLAHYFISFSN